jgi:phosphomannomutase
VIEAVAASGGIESVYNSPATEFELRRMDTVPGRTFHSGPDHGADIVIVTDADDRAEITLVAAGQQTPLRPGDIFLAPYGVEFAISASAPATLFRATVPDTPAELSFRGRQPTALRFGTSGLRGLVEDITDLEAYINAKGFLNYLFQTDGIAEGETVCIAGDLRPSTDSPERSVMRAVARAIEDSGLRVVNLGKIPTPALTYYAMQQGWASIMVTGSHIPFDRNGIKFNKKSGEVLKSDESGILAAVADVRETEYRRSGDVSIFADDGSFRPSEIRPLPHVREDAAEDYIQRYVDFFGDRALRGLRIVFFQHSAVGRDLIVILLERLGASVHPAGRSDQFIPIDTEDISDDRLRELQRMVDDVCREHGSVDAIISTDGDSDRPLLCGIESDGTVRFFGGDLLGIVVAEYLQADSVAVPISNNDAVDIQFAKRGIRAVKTKIGSPNVIAAMDRARAHGQYECIVSWEANGGFLTGSTVEKEGRQLRALPTRDAVLPLVGALVAARENECRVVDLFAQLPRRFSKAGLIDQFPQAASQAILRHYCPGDDKILDVEYEADNVVYTFADGRREQASAEAAREQLATRRELAAHFSPERGFAEITRMNMLDGLRIFFGNGDIAHIRPSGNAPQLRIYAVADTQQRANEIVSMGLLEPDGILRGLVM